MRQAFIFVANEASLRNVVAHVQLTLGKQMPNWGRYFVLFRLNGEYACIGLGALSGQLEQRAWRLDTPLATFRYQACVRRSPSGGDDHGQAPFLVTEQEGQPIKLDLVGALMPGMNRTGWWKLVGAYLAEQGKLPEWPDLHAAGLALNPIVQIKAETTLDELGTLLAQSGDKEDTVLAIQGSEPGEWILDNVQDLGQRIINARPQPAANSQAGAFIDPNHTALPSWHREQTPWPLVAAYLTESSNARVLLLQNGSPLGVLSRQHIMLSAPSSDDLTPKEAFALPRQTLADFLLQLETVQPGQPDHSRVVNSWFADERQQHVAPTFALAANRIYHLGVNIGESDPSLSNIKGEQPQIGAQVVRYAVEQGIPLTFYIDSEDFIVLESEKRVQLCQAGTAKAVFFRIATPVKTGLGTMRLLVYLRNNLIQSYVLFAHVAPTESAMPDHAVDGWWAECEYTLSADFSNLDAFRYRRVCVWLGKGHECLRSGMTGIAEMTETDMMASLDGQNGPQKTPGANAASRPPPRVAGRMGIDLGPVSDLNPVFLANALARYRQLLEEASIAKSDQIVTYLYQDDLTPADPAVFDRSIQSLAELGQMLYYRVFGESNGREIARQLHSIEQSQTGPMIVQIARLNLDLPFPWDIVYDRPLFYRPRHNTVCHEFINDPHCRETCPHIKDTNIICPYGFWGFRYIIEQPLRPPNAYVSVYTGIQAQEHPEMATVFGTGLGLTEQHRQTMTQITDNRAHIKQVNSVDGLLSTLKSQDDSPSVIYFYCHGGNTTYNQWLVVNDDDSLLTIHLDDEIRRVWEPSRQNGMAAPLVVLNGCHTGKYDPGTLLSFVYQFARLGAAGVIGTEIPIHEYMGRTFGEFWVDRFLNGEPIGQIIYDFRQHLLRKQNVLGLVYVPYCYADLHLESEAN
ncbi:MAG: CHAT domain-containing protein [Anaerolineae bacterium]|nr:CHAT domain-containing protein [Anaerolineae bacterium]